MCTVQIQLKVITVNYANSIKIIIDSVLIKQAKGRVNRIQCK